MAITIRERFTHLRWKHTNHDLHRHILNFMKKGFLTMRMVACQNKDSRLEIKLCSSIPIKLKNYLESNRNVHNVDLQQ